jgi:hypothetical protein
MNGALGVDGEATGRDRMRRRLVQLEADGSEGVPSHGLVVEEVVGRLGQKAHASVGARGIDQSEPDRGGGDIPAWFEGQVLMEDGIRAVSRN